MKWEYAIFEVETRDSSALIFDLNDIGRQGWEAVSLVPGERILMKRPLAPSKSEK